jgi:hypothetical protein
LANKITLKIEGEKEVLDLLARLPALVVSAGGPIDRAVTKASQIVAKRARQLAPDSRKNPNGNPRDKQSKKSRGIWGSKLNRKIKYKLIRYSSGAWSVVGAQSPDGNMAHFSQEKPRRMVLWGKATLIRQFRIERNWITKAFDETKAEQLAAIKASLVSDINANMKS